MTATKPDIIPAAPGYSLAIPYTRSSMPAADGDIYNAFRLEPIIAWAVQQHYQNPTAVRPNLLLIEMLPITARGYDLKGDAHVGHSGAVVHCPDGSFIVGRRKCFSELEALIATNRNRRKKRGHLARCSGSAGYTEMQP
jgi:hypothetical protein